MNHVILIGTIKKIEQEIQTNENNKYILVHLAIQNNFGSRRAENITCVLWNGLVENVKKHYKGNEDKVSIKGRLATKMRDSQGSFSAEVIAEQIMFLAK
ncbi:MAG: single-stranded DNA-binding protein [Culicoidibacterales bacterium]